MMDHPYLLLAVAVLAIILMGVGLLALLTAFDNEDHW